MTDVVAGDALEASFEALEQEHVEVEGLRVEGGSERRSRRSGLSSADGH